MMDKILYIILLIIISYSSLKGLINEGHTIISVILLMMWYNLENKFTKNMEEGQKDVFLSFLNE